MSTAMFVLSMLREEVDVAAGVRERLFDAIRRLLSELQLDAKQLSTREGLERLSASHAIHDRLLVIADSVADKGPAVRKLLRFEARTQADET